MRSTECPLVFLLCSAQKPRLHYDQPVCDIYVILVTPPFVDRWSAKWPITASHRPGHMHHGPPRSSTRHTSQPSSTPYLSCYSGTSRTNFTFLRLCIFYCILLYPPSERSETGVYTVFTFVGLSVRTHMNGLNDVLFAEECIRLVCEKLTEFPYGKELLGTSFY